MGDFDEFEEFEDEYDEDEFDTGEDTPVNNIPESFAKPKSMADIRSKLSGRPISRRPSPADEEDEYDEDDGAGGAGTPAPSGAHKETDANSPYSYIYDGDDEFGDAIETYGPAPSSAPSSAPDAGMDDDYGYVPTAGLSEPSIAPIGAPDDADEDNPYDFDETLDIDPDEGEDDFSAPPPPRALSYDFAGTDGDDGTDEGPGSDPDGADSGSSGPMYDNKGLGKLANALVGLFMK
jgi:hypothetical protein